MLTFWNQHFTTFWRKNQNFEFGKPKFDPFWDKNTEILTLFWYLNSRINVAFIETEMQTHLDLETECWSFETNILPHFGVRTKILTLEYQNLTYFEIKTPKFWHKYQIFFWQNILQILTKYQNFITFWPIKTKLLSLEN